MDNTDDRLCQDRYKYDYELVCADTVAGLNQVVKMKVDKGYRPMSGHTHQKANYQEVPERSQWECMFCISMERKP
tara:strand:+ start:81 stop:305 length:225 start_codon:yes stop_codon:yes gene_type:complete